MNDTAPTPALDEVMRAGCIAGWPEEPCEYPKCDGGCRSRLILAAALSAALADTPEVIEAMARAMIVDDGYNPDMTESPLHDPLWKSCEGNSRAVLAALRQHFLGEG